MTSLVDKMRKEPARGARVRILAVDPGLDIVGYATVLVAGTVPLVSALTFSEVEFGLLRAKEPDLKPLQQAQRTIARINAWLGQEIRLSQVVAVEGQQLYFKDDEGRDEIVGKGNDLIRLGQVTGAIQALAFSMGVTLVLSYLPAEWKGQRKKAPMHEEAAVQLAGIPVVARMRDASATQESRLATLDVDKLPKMMHHGLDALCLALFAADRIFREGKL